MLIIRAILQTNQARPFNSPYYVCSKKTVRKTVTIRIHIIYACFTVFLKVANRLSLTPNSGLGYAYEILYDFEKSRPSLQVSQGYLSGLNLSNWAKIKSIDETITYLFSDRKRNYYEKDAMCYPNNILHEAN